MHELPAESATSRAINGGRLPYGNLEHLVADLWALWTKQDHPTRAALQAEAQSSAKEARVIELRIRFEKRKRAYGLGRSR